MKAERTHFTRPPECGSRRPRLDYRNAEHVPGETAEALHAVLREALDAGDYETSAWLRRQLRTFTARARAQSQCGRRARPENNFTPGERAGGAAWRGASRLQPTEPQVKGTE